MAQNVRSSLSFAALAFVLCGFDATTLSGQKPATELQDAVFIGATVAAQHIQEAISEHIANDADFHLTKQLPEDKRPGPGILIKKDGSVSFDWTPGQRARDLMEELRQGIHQLQSVEKASVVSHY